MKKRILLVALVSLFCISIVAGCTSGADPDKDGKINIGAMNGPTMMGLGELYNIETNNADSKYTFKKEATADAIIAGLANKTLDAACVPANNAAILFNNGNIGIQVAAVNTLNVLYVLQKAGTTAITSLNDLEGKTVYLPGQGSTPEFAFRYLLAKNSIMNVTLEFETEGTMIAAGLKSPSSKYDYAVLPQPAATVAVSGEGAALEALNLTDEWKKHNPDSDIVTGVLVVRSEFLTNNKNTFDKFLSDYKKSVEFMTDSENINAAAGYVVDMGIVPQKPIAQKALQKCGITYMDEAEMKNILNDFYTVLHSQNTASIGGKIPQDSFYYGI